MPSTVLALPTEPIGSIPRPLALIEAAKAFERGQIGRSEIEPLYDDAIRKHHNFATYCVHGAGNFAPDGFKLQFVGHDRQWPLLVSGPFRYEHRAEQYLAQTLKLATRPVKQAVISPSVLSLFYPAEDIEGYPRDQFVADLIDQHEAEIRACLGRGAHAVQVDFTEGRLAHKLDPSGELLAGFVRLNNLALLRFSAAERQRIGVHTCPGGDSDSTHSADVDYAELLPSLFELRATHFYIALAREADRRRVLGMIRDHLKPEQCAFVGVVDPLDPRVVSTALASEILQRRVRS